METKQGAADNEDVEGNPKTSGEWTTVKLRKMYIESGESMQPIAEAINAALAAERERLTNEREKVKHLEQLWDNPDYIKIPRHEWKSLQEQLEVEREPLERILSK